MDANSAATLDERDPLARFRELFELPEGTIYLDGNSLGALPRGVADRTRRTVVEEWGRGLISSWTAANWIHLPQRVGDRIAPLIGARPGEVVVGDSTSVNLFKCLCVALKARSDRRTIVTEIENFPTDNYIIQGASDLLGGYDIRYVAPDADPCEEMDQSVAAVLFTHVNYRSAAIHDIERITRAAHDAGALTIWDLSHSTGAVPLDVTGAGVDFAVGCTYKYLNGGPGAPAFVYASPSLSEAAWQPLSGWLGHKQPFAFDLDYDPGEAIKRYICGTPEILSLAALDQSLSLWKQVDIAEVRKKSIGLTRYFMDLVETTCVGHALEIITPRDPDRRGSHVSIAYDHSYPVMRALAERDVIGDFRAPNLMRFGFAPLYVSYADTAAAVAALKEILDGGLWREARFNERLDVT